MEAAGGNEALKIFREPGKQIDLILLDICLPNCNGWELLKKFREINPYVPALALSAILPSVLAEKYRDAGFDGYITKPFFDIDKFSKTILAFLNPQRSSLTGANQKCL